MELLDLSSNCLENVLSANLGKLERLLYLDLSENRLNRLDNSDFKDLDQLKVLRISYFVKMEGQSFVAMGYRLFFRNCV